MIMGEDDAFDPSFGCARKYKVIMEYQSNMKYK